MHRLDAGAFGDETEQPRLAATRIRLNEKAGVDQRRSHSSFPPSIICPMVIAYTSQALPRPRLLFPGSLTSRMTTSFPLLPGINILNSSPGGVPALVGDISITELALESDADVPDSEIAETDSAFSEARVDR